MSWFFNFYNQKSKHTIKKIPVEIFRTYDDLIERREVVMTTEQSRKIHLVQINFEEGE